MNQQLHLEEFLCSMWLKNQWFPCNLSGNSFFIHHIPTYVDESNSGLNHMRSTIYQIDQNLTAEKKILSNIFFHSSLLFLCKGEPDTLRAIMYYTLWEHLQIVVAMVLFKGIVTNWWSSPYANSNCSKWSHDQEQQKRSLVG